MYSVYTLNQGTRRFHLKCVQCEHIEPKSKEVSFNMKGIFSCVRYYRKEIFAKGRGPVNIEGKMLKHYRMGSYVKVK